MKGIAGDTEVTVGQSLTIILLAAMLIIGSGLGLRDPWPPDEPRFALVAKEMVESGRWFFPTRGGELYPDKPPLFMWAQAAGYELSGSLRAAFLLPSLLSSLIILLLVFDLGRRLWSTKTGLLAAILLLLTPQFVLQGRMGQIDIMLAMWTTLGLYGAARHLLLGPAWRWFFVAMAAGGLGVITKGVGLIVLLILLPYLWATAHSWPGAQVRWRGEGLRWGLGAVAFFAAIALWLVPMLWITSTGDDAALVTYRDNILFKQTAQRYASAWHHIKPFWFFWVEVIPLFWLPLTLLSPWLAPRWLAALRSRDMRHLLLLGWAFLVVLFFSFSPGKRAQYILPALPAIALSAAPYISQLLTKRSVQRTAFLATLAITLFVATAFVWVTWIAPEFAHSYEEKHGLAPWPLLLGFAAVGIISLVLFRVRRGVLAFATFLSGIWVMLGLWGYPLFNGERSSLDLMTQVRTEIGSDTQLGLLGWREQTLLQAGPETTVFGFSRDPNAQSTDALRWLNAGPPRALLVEEKYLSPCLDAKAALLVRRAHRRMWYLVDSGAVSDDCRPTRSENQL